MELANDFFKRIEAYRVEFDALLRAAVKDGLSILAEAAHSKMFIPSYYDWPSVSFKDNGLPSFSSSALGSNKEYRRCFGDKEYNIKESNVDSFSDFLSFISSKGDLERRFVPLEWIELMGDSYLEVKSAIVLSVVKDAIERYAHVYECFDYDEEKCNVVIKEVSDFVFLDVLKIDIIVPILFVQFGFESYELSDGIEVRRLTEKEHLARYKIKSYNVSVHDSVISSATHALILKGYEVKNSPCVIEFNTLHNMRAYPIDLINKFFAAIRLVKNLGTGYAQVLSLAKNWVRHTKANLPHVVGITTRSYPTSFEDYYWNIDSVPIVSDIEMSAINRVFGLLTNATENSIDLSVRRLNQCLVRDSEEDSVLDATIALEALLSDDGNQEMTHKLAMRVGALVHLDSRWLKTPQQAFRDVKSIYAYRSAIVHGSKKPETKRVVKLGDNKETTTHALAVDYLRLVLKVLLENPKYRNPKVIDEELLLGCMNTSQSSKCQ